MSIIETIMLAVLAVLEKRPDVAARFRSVLGIAAQSGDDWIPIGRAPLARKTARRLARTGAIAARQVSGRWYFERASLNAYLRETKSTPVLADDDARLRADLGLIKVAS